MKNLQKKMRTGSDEVSVEIMAKTVEMCKEVKKKELKAWKAKNNELKATYM